MKNLNVYTASELKKFANSLMKNGKPLSIAMKKRINRKAKSVGDGELKHIILLAARIAIIKGKLNLSGNIDIYISEVQGVYDKVFANAGGFYPPPVWLPTLLTKINALAAAEKAVKDDVANAVATRNTAWVAVDLAMDDIVGFVNFCARGNQPNAVVIITGANMQVITRGVRIKEILSATRGKLSGTCRLMAKAVPFAKSYVWEYSKDGGITWITSIPITPGGRTIVTGLTPLTIVHFRYYAVTTRGNTDYCHPVYCVIL
jgi:hypothetical protein